MPGQSVVVQLLAEQRKRCMATIFTASENSTWWGRLSNEQQTQFKDQVRAALTVFYDLTRDLVKVTSADVDRNELALDLIRSIHSQQIKIVERLESDGGT